MENEESLRAEVKLLDAALASKSRELEESEAKRITAECHLEEAGKRLEEAQREREWWKDKHDKMAPCWAEDAAENVNMKEEIESLKAQLEEARKKIVSELPDKRDHKLTLIQLVSKLLNLRFYAEEEVRSEKSRADKACAEAGRLRNRLEQINDACDTREMRDSRIHHICAEALSSPSASEWLAGVKAGWHSEQVARLKELYRLSYPAEHIAMDAARERELACIRAEQMYHEAKAKEA